MPVRLVNAGAVPYLRSQTVYHGVARAFSKDTPNTIILVSPEDPYVCIGYHQELDKEVDVEFCASNEIPVVRREVGGGAVYLDANQVFTQWVFRPGSLPMRMEERFKLHAYPIIAVYKSLGIEAFFRPINDIQVKGGKKIGGMGAAAIGNAEVVVSSLMFDFNFELMAKVLKVPDEKFRDKIYQSLQEYMTTMKKELGAKPRREMIKELYIEKCEEILKEKVEEGHFTDAELQAMEVLDEKFPTEEWLKLKGSHVRPAVKIHSGVWVGDTTYKATGGLIRARIRIRDSYIDDISLSGDFTFYPQTRLIDFEKTLLQTEVTEEKLLEKIRNFYRESGVQSPGVEAEDWVKAITMFAKSIEEG